jgi:hypothetical protein
MAVPAIGEWSGEPEDDQSVRIQEKNDRAEIEFSKVTVGDALCDTLGFREPISLTLTKHCCRLNPPGVSRAFRESRSQC